MMRSPSCFKTTLAISWSSFRENTEPVGLQGEENRQEVEFVPVPGGYGFERIRLRMESELPGERRPVQPVIVPEGKTAPPGVAVPQEHAQPYANLG